MFVLEQQWDEWESGCVSVCEIKRTREGRKQKLSRRSLLFYSLWLYKLRKQHFAWIQNNNAQLNTHQECNLNRGNTNTQREKKIFTRFKLFSWLRRPVSNRVKSMCICMYSVLLTLLPLFFLLLYAIKKHHTQNRCRALLLVYWLFFLLFIRICLVNFKLHWNYTCFLYASANFHNTSFSLKKILLYTACKMVGISV